MANWYRGTVVADPEQFVSQMCKKTLNQRKQNKNTQACAMLFCQTWSKNFNIYLKNERVKPFILRPSSVGLRLERRSNRQSLCSTTSREFDRHLGWKVVPHLRWVQTWTSLRQQDSPGRNSGSSRR
jgi:hypothetical protein